MKVPTLPQIVFLVDYLKLKDNWAWIEAKGKDYNLLKSNLDGPL